MGTKKIGPIYNDVRSWWILTSEKNYYFVYDPFHYKGNLEYTCLLPVW